MMIPIGDFLLFTLSVLSQIDRVFDYHFEGAILLHFEHCIRSNRLPLGSNADDHIFELVDLVQSIPCEGKISSRTVFNFCGPEGEYDRREV